MSVFSRYIASAALSGLLVMNSFNIRVWCCFFVFATSTYSVIIKINLNVPEGGSQSGHVLPIMLTGHNPSSPSSQSLSYLYKTTNEIQADVKVISLSEDDLIFANELLCHHDFDICEENRIRIHVDMDSYTSKNV